MPKGDKPTLKQRKFAKKYIENGGNASKAIMEVYDVKQQNAKTLGYQNLQKPIVQKTIQELLNKNGLNLEDITGMTTKMITHNMKYGKASQAVASDLLKFTYKLHNAIPDKAHRVVKEERKILVDKDFNVLKEELTQSVSTTNQLLQDL